MTHGDQSRWQTLCWVHDADRAPFSFILRPSRMRNLLDALIRSGATGCNVADLPTSNPEAAIGRLRSEFGLRVTTIRGNRADERQARYALVTKVTPEADEGSQ